VGSPAPHDFWCRPSFCRAVWSRFAASYDRDGEYVVGNAILQEILKRLRKERSLGYTIEFGCGTGYFTKAIAANATQVIATDLSDAMLEVARVELRGFGNVAIQKADCRDSRFPAVSFDTAILVNLVHVIENPSQCLQEANGIVRHRGSLIVVDFTGYGMSFPKKMSLVFKYLRKWGRPPRCGQNNLSPKELVCLVEDSGFEVKAVELLEAGANALYLKGEKR
jgi:ubiquinone/menaquinone biosynthesis C-methylase UbiE